jgi:hypothetical protein
MTLIRPRLRISRHFVQSLRTEALITLATKFPMNWQRQRHTDNHSELGSPSFQLGMAADSTAAVATGLRRIQLRRWRRQWARGRGYKRATAATKKEKERKNGDLFRRFTRARVCCRRSGDASSQDWPRTKPARI